MLTNKFKGITLSRLGFGTMRLPVIGGNAARIDEKQVDEMVDYAISHGINYFDTAYPYHGGMSEKVIGRSLSRYPRERAIILPPSIRDTNSAAATIPPRPLRNSSKNAAWTTLTFTCCTMSTKTPSRSTRMNAGGLSIISWSRSGRDVSSTWASPATGGWKPCGSFWTTAATRWNSARFS